MKKYRPEADATMRILSKGERGLPPAPGSKANRYSLTWSGTGPLTTGDKGTQTIIPDGRQDLVWAWLDELAKFSPDDYQSVLDNFGLEAGGDIPADILQEVADDVRERLDHWRDHVSDMNREDPERYKVLQALKSVVFAHTDRDAGEIAGAEILSRVGGTNRLSVLPEDKFGAVIAACVAHVGARMDANLERHRAQAERDLRSRRSVNPRR